jgi:acyl carrier protein
MNNISSEIPQGDEVAAQELALAQFIVTTLNLDVDPKQVDPLAPLYGEGLGLDSIDVLEISLAISKTYGVQLRADDEHNLSTFSSLRNLNQHIQLHRTK